MRFSLRYSMDEEFREIFKVHADFRRTMELDPQHVIVYGQWIAHICRTEGLPHFDRSALDRIVEFGARKAGDRQKVSASHSEIADLAREAAYWARQEQSALVSAHHVQKTITERVFRSNRIEEDIMTSSPKGRFSLTLMATRSGR